jgi:branched-subunit amino acid aminotransferase/4-amino-4-deoxychorismate lyase
MQVWLNGRFVSGAEAVVSVFDAGLQHGVGLFETMGARHGRVFRLAAHVERLAASAAALRLTARLRSGPLAEAVQATLERSGLKAARVRVTITGGDLGRLQATGQSALDPTIVVVAQPPTEYPDELFQQGVRVVVAGARANPLDPGAGHKTLAYWSRIAALQQAAAARAGEALWFSTTNHLASGSVSNVFLVRGGELHTPLARGEEAPGTVPNPVLPGITRAAIHELADATGVAHRAGMLTIDDVLGADEAFLTNSSWGVLPVVGVERAAIGGGAVGPVTSRLRAAWLELVERETSAGT